MSGSCASSISERGWQCTHTHTRHMTVKVRKPLPTISPVPIITHHIQACQDVLWFYDGLYHNSSNIHVHPNSYLSSGAFDAVFIQGQWLYRVGVYYNSWESWVAFINKGKWFLHIRGCLYTLLGLIKGWESSPQQVNKCDIIGKCCTSWDCLHLDGMGSKQDWKRGGNRLVAIH